MKIVVFGLAVSSSWGNGHATLWRGLIAALARRHCHTVFFEHDRPYYAAARDIDALSGGELVIYEDWETITARARREVRDADAVIVTSYCPDARVATRLLENAGRPLRVFYDLDTPVTLATLREGGHVDYIGPEGLRSFDLVLSYTGGAALEELMARLGARRVAPLWGHVDPDVHYPVAPTEHFRADLSYIGTYAEDRQQALQTLLVTAARQRPTARFLIAGAQYPKTFPWAQNIWFAHHVMPTQHPAFFASSRLTLNVTRRSMAEMGWCPSGRLFEAAACGAAILSDNWPGLRDFFVPDRELLLARSTTDVLAALDRSDQELRAIGAAARARVMAEHTSDHRAGELLALLEDVRRVPTASPPAGLEV